MRTQDTLRSAMFLFIAVSLALLAPSQALASYAGKKFPNFTGKDARTGKKINLEDLKGQVVLVDFWATWCGPCVREIPNIKSTYDRFKDKGFTVVSISLDSDKAKCKAYISDRGMDWLHIIDGGGWNTRLAKKYGIRSIPSMFLIDHQGVCITDRARGESLAGEVEKAVKKIPADAAKPKPNPKPNESPDPNDSPLPPAKSSPTPQSPPHPPPAPKPAGPSAAQIKAMQAELAPLERDLADIAKLLRGYLQRIDAAEQSIAGIESDLPSPKRAASTRDAYRRLRTEIVELRRDLFAMGLLNERQIAAPYDPFNGQPLSELRPFFQAKSQIPVAVKALGEMKQVVTPEAESLSTMTGDLAQLKGDVSTGNGAPEALQAQCNDFAEDARAEIDRWRRAWQNQLGQLHEVVVQINAPTAQLNARSDEIDGQISSIRAHLADRASGSDAISRARQEFTEMLASLNGLGQQLNSLGVAKSIKMPANPFEKRSANDRLLAAEAEVQLKVAVESNRQLRTAIEGLSGDAARRAESFLPRIKQLQSEINGDAADPKSVTGVQAAYHDLCGDILATQDKNSPS